MDDLDRFKLRNQVMARLLVQDLEGVLVALRLLFPEVEISVKRRTIVAEEK